jgi:hypothetical protein
LAGGVAARRQWDRSSPVRGGDLRSPTFNVRVERHAQYNKDVEFSRCATTPDPAGRTARIVRKYAGFCRSLVA